MTDEYDNIKAQASWFYLKIISVKVQLNGGLQNDFMFTCIIDTGVYICEINNN